MAESTYRATGQQAAFFDLDRTLISGSSAFTFAIAAWRKDMVPSSQFARTRPVPSPSSCEATAATTRAWPRSASASSEPSRAPSSRTWWR